MLRTDAEAASVPSELKRPGRIFLPIFRDSRKGKRTLVGNSAGLLSRGKQIRGVPHSQAVTWCSGCGPSDGGKIGAGALCCSPLRAPVHSKSNHPRVRSDPIPQLIEFDRLISRPRETEKILMNKARPFLHQSWLAYATALERQSKDGGTQWLCIESHRNWGIYVCRGPSLDGPQRTYPAILPAGTARDLERVQRGCRKQTGEALSANPPAPIHKYTAATTGAGE